MWLQTSLRFLRLDSQPRGKLDCLSSLIEKFNLPELHIRLRLSLCFEEFALPVSAQLGSDDVFEPRVLVFLDSIRRFGHKAEIATVAIFASKIARLRVFMRQHPL